MRVLIATALCWAFMVFAQGRTLQVPQQYSTIGLAVNDAVAGDIVLISPGLYRENIATRKAISFRSIDPANSDVVARTIIDGQRMAGVFSLVPYNAILTTVTVAGLTIRNGYARYQNGGGGIEADGYVHVGIIIEHCVIENNWSELNGGGVFASSEAAGLVIRRCVIRNNHSFHIRNGGGIDVHGATARIENCEVTSNTAGYGGGIYGSVPIRNCLVTRNVARRENGYGGRGGGILGRGPIENCIIAENVASDYGGGVDSGAEGNPSAIQNCTIVGNRAGATGGGVVYLTGNVLRNSIVWGNVAPRNAQIDYTPKITSGPLFCCIQDWTTHTLGTISADPRFVGPADFHLRRLSPCIDRGSDIGAPPLDFEGNRRPVDGNGDGTVRADMGAYEYTLPISVVSRMLWTRYR